MPETANPSFNQSVQDRPAIMATEQGRNEASFIANKADEIITRRTASFEENGRAWFEGKVKTLTEKAGYDYNQWPPPPPPVWDQVHRQAGEEYRQARDNIARRVNDVRNGMFARPPGENHIRGYDAPQPKSEPVIEPVKEPAPQVRSIFARAAEPPITGNFNDQSRGHER